MMSAGERPAGMEHIPKYPPGWVTVRILQLIISLVCLGLSAYTLAAVTWAANCLMIFISVITVGVTIWLTAAHTCAKRAFNYWASLFFDIFFCIFWLVSLAVCAVSAGALIGSSYYDYDFDDFDDIYDDYYDDFDYDIYDGVYGDVDWSKATPKVLSAVMGAMAGLGALNLLLFSISLIVTACVIFRHRRAGLHSKPVKGGAPVAVGQPYQMTPQSSPNYAAVPQHGMPFNQQDTAYNPHGMYSPPVQQQQQPQVYAQQGYYGGAQPQQAYYPPPSTSPAPVQPKPTGDPYHTSVSPQPPQGAYQAPYQPPYYQKQ